MRPLLLVPLLLIAAPARAEDRPAYAVDDSSKLVSSLYKNADGKIVYDLTFRVKLVGGGPVSGDVRDRVVIKENGREVHRFDLRTARVRDLTAVLAFDVSGSMKRLSKSGKPKMDEARDAAHLFLDKLHPRANLGLTLFDHQIKKVKVPADSPEGIPARRQEVAGLIDDAQPEGGTAYYDACWKSLDVLRDFNKGSRAVVLVTDGVDVNSTRDARHVIHEAKKLQTPIYTIGVGDPGWTDPVATVLVLDHSGSMAEKAGSDEKTKMQALHEAASRFIDLMRPDAQATVLPFSSRWSRPEPFTNDKGRLQALVRALQPEGGTALFTPIAQAIDSVRTRGAKKFVVALTDGREEDSDNQHSPDDVIALAKEAGVKVYMLGLGRKEDVEEGVMRKVAEATGGKYFHAENQQKLLEIFEEVSLDIHGDGIDEAALKHLASETGGKYYRAADASELALKYAELASDLDDTFKVTVPSLNQKLDGTVSGLEIIVVDKDEKVISNVTKVELSREGLVVSDVDYRVYLLLLATLLGLLYLPTALRPRPTA